MAQLFKDFYNVEKMEKNGSNLPAGRQVVEVILNFSLNLNSIYQHSSNCISATAHRQHRLQYSLGGFAIAIGIGSHGHGVVCGFVGE